MLLIQTSRQTIHVGVATYTGHPEDYPPHLAFTIVHLLHLKRPSLPVMIFCKNVVEHIFEMFT